MANEQNLIPGAHPLTVEEQSRGGKASGKARRERRALADAFNALLSLPEMPGDTERLEAVLSAADLESANLTVQDRIALAVVARARRGDTRAVELIRDTVGEKPADRLEVDVSADVSAAGERIRELVRRRNDEQLRKASILEELCGLPGLPGRARELLSELYRHEMGERV